MSWKFGSHHFTKSSIAIWCVGLDKNLELPLVYFATYHGFSKSCSLFNPLNMEVVYRNLPFVCFKCQQITQVFGMNPIFWTIWSCSVLESQYPSLWLARCSGWALLQSSALKMGISLNWSIPLFPYTEISEAVMFPGYFQIVGLSLYKPMISHCFNIYVLE